MPKLLSNHLPMMLEIEVVPNGHTPFRLENVRLKVAGFKEIIKSE